jgi:hypothetical protein
MAAPLIDSAAIVAGREWMTARGVQRQWTTVTTGATGDGGILRENPCAWNQRVEVARRSLADDRDTADKATRVGTTSRVE